MTERVVLVGFMGAGKSTLAPRVAALLGWDSLDMDREIERRLGMSVAVAFTRLGEEAFRCEELAVARDLQSRSRVVVAAGGGAFARPATRELLREGALCLWLRVPLAVAEQRIGSGADRPLAANRARIRALYATRKASYAEADRVVDTGDCGPAEAARRVFEVVSACRSAKAGEGDTGCGT